MGITAALGLTASEGSQPSVVPQYGNIAVPLRNCQQRKGQAIVSLAESLGWTVQVCSSTILTSVTEIEGTLKECILPVDSLTNAIKDALSVSLFKERLREQDSSMFSFGQARKSSEKKQAASPQSIHPGHNYSSPAPPSTEGCTRQVSCLGTASDPQLPEQGHCMQLISSPCPFSTHRSS